MADKEIQRVEAVNGALNVEFADGKTIKFEECWLRDHCRCESCYHADTFQRAKHILEIPDTTVVNFQYDKSQITVTWSDDHESAFTSEFLSKFDFKKWKESKRLKPILWKGPSVSNKIAKVDGDDFIHSVEAQKRVFQSLIDYGVVLIDGVDPTLDATESICILLGGVQHTLFGGMWQLTSKAVHADTAYTNLPLAVHNDNTYFTEAAGLQILHCIEHTGGSGGKTILVDGFYGASCLREDNPEDFEFLTTFDVEAEYIEEGHHHTFSAPVIQIDRKTQDLKQIRFNVYDRSPMAFSGSDECKLYYRSLRNLASYYEAPENQWQFKLAPGTVMVMDNFRVLHGRTRFSGKRVLCGCYVARSNWLDRSRVLGLIQ